MSWMLPRDSVHGGQHLWGPECDPLICSPPQGMEQLWAGQDLRSQETPENLENTDVVQHSLAHSSGFCVYLGYKV